MELVKQEKFGTLVMDFYMDENKEIWATRKQIGEALGYADPQKAIDKLHERNKARLDKLATTVNLGVVEGNRKLRRNTILYNSKGIMEICRWARTDKADDFFDWVTDVIDELRRNGVFISQSATSEQKVYNYNMLEETFKRTGAEFFMDEYKKCIEFHAKNKTRLEYEKSNKNRRKDKKKTVAESKIAVMQRILNIAKEREQQYRVNFKWELKSLMSDAVKNIELDIKEVKHNQTRGKLAQANKRIG